LAQAFTFRAFGAEKQLLIQSSTFSLRLFATALRSLRFRSLFYRKGREEPAKKRRAIQIKSGNFNRYLAVARTAYLSISA
jgi:hypothetical protein